MEVDCPICGAPTGERCWAALPQADGPHGLEGLRARVAHRLRTAMAARDAGLDLSARERDTLHRAGLSSRRVDRSPS